MRRIVEGNFTEKDGVFSRLKTVGVEELRWKENSSLLNFSILDIGGDRGQRSGWSKYFDKTKLVIVCISLSEYNEWVEEDEAENCMIESLSVAEILFNCRWFWNREVVLVLNKIDVFLNKIQHIDLSCCFSDYTGKSASMICQFTYEKEDVVLVMRYTLLYQRFIVCLQEKREFLHLY
jgi:guanine nucleotide-binding protein G(i) subunit alpha